MKLLTTCVLTALLCCLSRGAYANELSTAHQQSEALPASAQADLAEAERLSATLVGLYSTRKYDEAFNVGNKVLQLRERAVGQEHPLVAHALFNLGNVQVARGKRGEAKKLFERAVSIYEKAPKSGAQLSETLLQLAFLSSADRDAKTSETYFKRSLAVKGETYGEEHPEVLRPLVNLVNFYLHRKEADKAEELVGRAVAILKKHPERKYPSLAVTLRQAHCIAGDLAWRNKADKVFRLMKWLEDPEKAAEEETMLEQLKSGELSETESGVLTGRAIQRVQPSYPDAAKNARVTGTVAIQVVVNEEGEVISAEAICGHPLLKKAAEEAVWKWRFSPTLLKGQPVKVTGIVTVNFFLM